MKFLKTAVASAVTSALVLGSQLVHAADTSAADGAAAVTGLVAGQSGYLGSMIALALAGVGIGIAVKWVKRAKGAA
ncbi:MAG: hypothetical protein ABI671_12090 [Burkholderiales bacterium]